MNIAGIALMATMLTPADLAAQFQQDFRKIPVKPAVLKFTGKNAKKFIHFKPGGIQFNFPDNKGSAIAPVGVRPRFKIRGNFEITVSFEILHEEEPNPASSGLNMHIYIDTNTTHGATILRSNKPGTGVQFIAHKLIRDDKSKGKHSFHPKKLTTDGKTGQLRLKRVGSTLSFLAAEGDKAKFQTLYETEWEKDDLRFVRIGGTNSKAAVPFKFRILSIDIKSEEMPTYPSQAQGGSSFPFLLVLGIVAIAAVAGGFWYWRRHQSVQQVRKAKE